MMRGRRAHLCTAAVVAMALLVLPAVAVAATDESAEPSGPARPEARADVLGADFRMSGCTGTGGEWLGAVAWNGSANQGLVVWDDGRKQATRRSDTPGRRLSGWTERAAGGEGGTPARRGVSPTGSLVKGKNRRARCLRRWSSAASPGAVRLSRIGRVRPACGR